MLNFICCVWKCIVIICGGIYNYVDRFWVNVSYFNGFFIGFCFYGSSGFICFNNMLFFYFGMVSDLFVIGVYYLF